MVDMVDMSEKREYVAVGEAAFMLDVHPQTIVRWCNEGRLEHRLTLGGHRRIPRDVIDAINTDGRIG